MRIRATTAVVTVHFADDDHEERVTPLNLIRSGWINPQNVHADPLAPQILVQVAVERLVRRLQRGFRSVTVYVMPATYVPGLTNGRWEAYLPAWYSWSQSGEFTLVTGVDECLDATRVMLGSES